MVMRGVGVTKLVGIGVKFGAREVDEVSKTAIYTNSVLMRSI
jgi:hypothetical protein